MTQLLYGSIQRAGVRIHYYRTGGVKPPVILLHGLTDNALCWNRMPLLLEAEYDVVLVDARGHGLSGLDARGAGLDVQAEDIAALIEQLNLIRPVLIGHSMGAAAAALTASRLPKVIRAVILIDPPWRDEVEIADGGKERLPESVRAGFLENKHLDLDALQVKVQREHPNWDESEYLQWAKAKQQFNPDALDTIIIREFPWHSIAPKLACPGLLITGDPNLGAIITPALARKIDRLWKKGKVVNIPGAGHSIHRDQYDLVMRVVNNFLRSLGRWSAREK